MILLRTFALLLSAAVLTACSTTDTEKVSEKPANLTNYTPTAKIDTRWHFRVGDNINNQLTPAVTRDAVYAANGDGKVYKLDPVTGKLLWKVDSGFTISGGVGAGADLVLVGGLKGQVVAYQATDGKLLWNVRVSSEVAGAPRVANGIVVVRTGDGRIAGLNANDGSRRWLYERATPGLVARNAGFPAGKLAAINLENGIIVWESSVSTPRGTTELERISDITSLPVVDDKQVCAVAFQGRLACFEDERGGTLWTRDFSSDKGLTLSRRYLYLTDSNGVVMALDKLSGSTLWKSEALRLRGVSAPFASETHIVVGDEDGYLHIFGKEDGQLMARLRTDSSEIISTPIALEDGLLVQTAKGELYSLVIH
jgi:outer membrane protein assembly factor BamB